MAHHVDEAIAFAVEDRDDDLFEFPVKRRRVARGAVGIRRRFLACLANGPAGFAFDPAFDPPTVENAQTGHAVERRLHAAGAGGFEGR